MSWCKKGQFDLHRKIEEIGEENCLLSEITIAELKFGAENSIQKK
jgi:tRNA(fMet)-specific endonuclease VapC